jgi:tetratricopeptide (TPR) repeat protein
MQLIGKYEVIAEIGAGSVGAIFRARDQALDREVALKVLRTDADLDPELKERFYREARACARLAHPNIITVYDLGEAGGTVFIAMELLSGSDLRKLLQENRTPDLAVKLDVMAQVCDALGYAHSQHLVHRDIKPSNIFLCDDQRVKVLDFGIAKLPISNVTMEGKVLGTPNYMAPEQIRGGICDGRSDLFSAAIVFCEFLTGAHPFQEEFIPRRIAGSAPDSPRQKDPGIPEALESLLLRALEKDPAQRVQTAAEFAAGLRSVLATVRGGQVAAAPQLVFTPSPPAVEPAAPPLTDEEVAERRVSEFLRIVADFDDAIEKRNAQAARAALEQMRYLAAGDSRFDVAVSDCEALLHEKIPVERTSAPRPTAEVTTGSGPKAASNMELPEPHRPATTQLPDSPPAPALKGKSRAGLAVAAVVILVIAVVGMVRLNKNSSAEKPIIPLSPAVATALVGPNTADLLAAPNPSGQRLAVLHHGDPLNVIALPESRDQEYTSVRGADRATPAGFVRTADLSDWSGSSAEASFSVAKLFQPAEAANEAELNAQLEKWDQFIGRYPASPHVPEASLEAAHIEFALGKLSKAEGKPAAEWQAHMQRAKEALDSVRNAPALEGQVAELRRQLSNPSPVSPSGPLPPEKILRGKVNSLWEAGQYQRAMHLVDMILAVTPDHQEALAWKKKIRASQEAEANAR